MDPDSVALSLTKKNLTNKLVSPRFNPCFFLPYCVLYVCKNVSKYLGVIFTISKQKGKTLKKRSTVKFNFLRRNSDPESQIRKKTHCMRIRHTVETIKWHINAACNPSQYTVLYNLYRCNIHWLYRQLGCLLMRTGPNLEVPRYSQPSKLSHYGRGGGEGGSWQFWNKVKLYQNRTVVESYLLPYCIPYCTQVWRGQAKKCFDADLFVKIHLLRGHLVGIWINIFFLPGTSRRISSVRFRSKL